MASFFVAHGKVKIIAKKINNNQQWLEIRVDMIEIYNDRQLNDILQ